MLSIPALVKMRKLLGITGDVIAEEMDTTKQTISNIELGKAENTMSVRFYKLTVLKLVKNIHKIDKEDLIFDLHNIIKYLESEENTNDK